MAVDNTYGVSGTSLTALPQGALKALGGAKNVAAAEQIARSLVPQREPVDPALLSLLFFTQMASEASKPGATALGAAASAAATPANYLIQERQRQKEAEAKLPETALNIAQMIKPPVVKPGVGVDITKGEPVMDESGNPKRTAEGAPIYNYYKTDKATGTTTQFQAPDLAASAQAKPITLYNAAGQGKLVPVGSQAYNDAVAGTGEFIYTTKPSKTSTSLKSFVIKDGAQPITLGGITYNPGDPILLTGDESVTYRGSIAEAPKSESIKTVGSGTIAKYMTAEEAKAAVKGLGLDESNPNFNTIVERLTAKTDDQIGQPLTDAGVFIELVPLVKGDSVVNLQFTPSKTAATPYFTTYVEKRLPLIAKSADTYNTTAREVIPRVDEAMALLKSGNVETGRLNQALLPFKQVFNQAFGINDPEVMGLETLQATSNFLAPKMRPVGSGSTSDMEFRAYQQAALYLGNTPEANYISLYAFKKMAENGVRLNQLEQELLTSGEYSNMRDVNAQLNDFDSGIFEKYTGDPNSEEDVTAWWNSLPDGAVAINNGLFASDSPYLIKGWGS